MPLVQLIVMLIVIGVILYLANTYLPMEATIKKIMNIVVIIAVCLYVLSVFGLLPNINAIRVGG